MTLYDNVTREEWVEELQPNQVWNKRHLLSLFSLFGTPGTMLDVGCGLGVTVDIARKLHVEAYGVDQLVNSDFNVDWYFPADLRKPFSLGDKKGRPSVVDLVLCWEVAEHIPTEDCQVFCDTVANHLKSAGNSLLVFTAAHPGQTGTKHANVHPATYWRDRFHERGLTFRDDKSKNLALLWSNIQSPMYWLSANCSVYEK